MASCMPDVSVAAAVSIRIMFCEQHNPCCIDKLQSQPLWDTSASAGYLSSTAVRLITITGKAAAMKQHDVMMKAIGL